MIIILWGGTSLERKKVKVNAFEQDGKMKDKYPGQYKSKRKCPYMSITK